MKRVLGQLVTDRASKEKGYVNYLVQREIISVASCRLPVVGCRNRASPHEPGKRQFDAGQGGNITRKPAIIESGAKTNPDVFAIITTTNQTDEAGWA